MASLKPIVALPAAQIVDAGQMLPDNSKDGLIELGPAWAAKLKLKTGTVVRHLTGSAIRWRARKTLALRGTAQEERRARKSYRAVGLGLRSITVAEAAKLLSSRSSLEYRGVAPLGQHFGQFSIAIAPGWPSTWQTNLS